MLPKSQENPRVGWLTRSRTIRVEQGGVVTASRVGPVWSPYCELQYAVRYITVGILPRDNLQICPFETRGS